MSPRRPRDERALAESQLAAGSRARLHAAWKLSMRERLARLDRLCKSVGDMKGAANRRSG